jgi:hypothetical protein
MDEPPGDETPLKDEPCLGHWAKKRNTTTPTYQVLALKVQKRIDEHQTILSGPFQSHHSIQTRGDVFQFLPPGHGLFHRAREFYFQPTDPGIDLSGLCPCQLESELDQSIGLRAKQQNNKTTKQQNNNDSRHLCWRQISTWRSDSRFHAANFRIAFHCPLSTLPPTGTCVRTTEHFGSIHAVLA